MALHIWNCSLCNASHHTLIQANDVIPILPPAVGWVAAATLVVMFPKDSWIVVCELCLMLGGTKMWLIGFHILALIMLYSLVTSTLWKL